MKISAPRRLIASLAAATIPAAGLMITAPASAAPSDTGDILYDCTTPVSQGQSTVNMSTDAPSELDVNATYSAGKFTASIVIPKTTVNTARNFLAAETVEGDAKPIVTIGDGEPQTLSLPITSTQLVADTDALMVGIGVLPDLVAGATPGKMDILGGDVSFVLDFKKADGTYAWEDMTITCTAPVADPNPLVDTVKVVEPSTMTVSAPNRTYGRPAQFDARVSSDGDTAGRVQFKVKGKTVTANVVDGLATATISGLPAGNHTVAASYIPTGTAASATASDTIAIAKARSTTNVVPTASAFRKGSRPAFKVTVKSRYGGAVSGRVRVKVSIGGVSAAVTVKLKWGKARAVLPARLTNRRGFGTAMATYNGDSNVKRSTDKVGFRVVR